MKRMIEKMDLRIENVGVLFVLAETADHGSEWTKLNWQVKLCATDVEICYGEAERGIASGIGT